MTYVVEKIDPRSTRPDLTDETFEHETPFDAAIRVEDLAGLNPLEVAAEIVGQESFKHTDPETGVEVIARRA